MGERRHPAEVEIVAWVAGGEDAPLLEAHILGRGVKLLAGNPRQALAHPYRREVRGTRDRTRKAARIVAGGDGPGVSLGVVLPVRP